MQIVYIRLKKQLILKEYRQLALGQIASISAPENLLQPLREIPVYQLSKKDKNLLVLDQFFILQKLHERYNDLEIHFIGPDHITVRIEKKKRKASVLFVAFIWILLFIGTAMTIMNFHYDVSMEDVQSRLHYLLTGEKNKNPLWIQIPYSIGLGAGMILFYNHWFKKRFNEEPSPLEVEVFNYEEDMDNYMYHHENQIDDNDSR